MNKPAFFLCLFSFSAVADLTGTLTLQTQNFIEDALWDEQLENDVSVSIMQRYTHSWNNGNDLFRAEVFARDGSQDREKNHVDIREFMWLHVAGDYEIRLGINSVFWGVTEAQNLVDIINQKDAVEGIDNEKKLGQPMLQFTAVKDWGVIDAFLLLGFRERTFAGEKGRPRTPLVIALDAAQFESGEKQKKLDYALRYSHYYADIDYALSVFKGTQREPLLQPGLQKGLPVLIPFYPQITQIGVEVQTIVDAWLWKLEAIYVESSGGNYSAATAGFEYSFYGVWGSAVDVGTIVEYLYDSRGDDAPTAFNHDAFIGARLTFNDIQSSSILAGMMMDSVNQTRLLRIEAERRLGDNWKLTAEALLYGNIDQGDILYPIRKDNALKVELTYHF